MHFFMRFVSRKMGTQYILDRLSIGASVVCAVHCAVLPLLLTLSPAIALFMGDEHYFHWILVWLVLPTSFIAALMGCRRHRDLLVMAGIGLGLVLLVATAIYGHDLLGENGERIATVCAAFLLAVSHWRNYTLCRRQDCCHEASE